MATYFLYEVAIPEDKKTEFEDICARHGIKFRETSFYRVTNLTDFFSGVQKGLD